MTLDASPHATLADVKRGVLRSERVMVKSVVRQVGEFRPLYRGLCLGSLITRYVGHNRSASRHGEGITALNGHPKRSAGQIL